MALSQQQWFEKLKSFVPTWFFQDQDLNVAIFQAIAKVLSERQESNEYYLAETFLLDSGDFLGLHGAERNVIRLPGEPDDVYRERIRFIQNTIALNTLFPAVEGVLNNGDPIFIENWAYGFADDELFCDCEDSIFISRTKQYNRFTVIIPIQEVEDAQDQEIIKKLIVEVLDKFKAVGILYDVFYEVQEELTDEDGDYLTTEDDELLLTEI